VIRVGETRVLFELVVRSFRDGNAPDDIVREYPALSLADVYGAISYALQHPAQVETYLRERQQNAREVRKTLDANNVAVDVTTESTSR
jgi:uncharacterized protein (DUF433 family)